MMKMRTFLLALGMGIVFVGARERTYGGESPEAQYEFAGSLLAEGDAPAAIVEYRRFLHFYRQHPLAPEAQLKIGAIYLSHVGDLERGRTTLQQVTKNFPRSEAASRATKLLTFLDENNDFEGRPLRRYLAAKGMANRGEVAEAVRHFRSIADEFPQARLAEPSLYEAAKIALESPDQIEEAIQILSRILREYPQTPHKEEIIYLSAVAVEKKRGPGPEAIEAYQKVITTIPQTEFAQKAEARIAEIRKSAYLLERQRDKRLVQRYNVIKQGYRANDPECFLIQVEIPTASPEAIEATLEDVLLQYYRNRSKDSHRVRILAYYSYPLSEAGEANWTPGGTPTYQVKKREKKETVRDIFLDIFKEALEKR